MSETQLRNSPSGKGTSLVGLEKDVCQRESALLRVKGRRGKPGRKELPQGRKEESSFTEIRLFSNKRARRAAAASHDPPCARRVLWPPRPSRGSGEPPWRGGVCAAGQQLGSGCRNRARSRAGFGSAGSAELRHGLWRTPVNSLSHISVKKSTLCRALPRYTERQTDRETGSSRRCCRLAATRATQAWRAKRGRCVPASGQAGWWRRQWTRSEAPWRAKRWSRGRSLRTARKQRAAPARTYGRGIGSTAWWWGCAGRPSQGAGAAQELGHRAPSSPRRERVEGVQATAPGPV